MDLIIEKRDLKILLDEYRENIGNYKCKEQAMNFFAIVFALFSSEFKNLWVIKKEWIFIGYIIYTIYILYECVVSIVKSKTNNITSDKLLDKIAELDSKTHNHTILMIKDKFNDFSNRYLLYNDVRWDSMLFLNKKTLQDRETHEENITRYISDKLHVDKENIDIEFKTEQVHTKYSKSADVYKKYRHQFYEINILEFPEQLKNNSFEIDGTEYKWMTLREMWMDEKIVKDNSDIVGYVQAIYE